MKIAKTQIFPCALRYQNELAATCANLKAAGHDYTMSTLEDVTAKLRSLQKAVAELEDQVKEENGDTHAEARYLCDKIMPAMLKVRAFADQLEGVVADDLWPLPSYQEMLFIK